MGSSLTQTWKDYVKADFENKFKTGGSEPVSGTYFTEQFNDGCVINSSGIPPVIKNKTNVTHWIVNGTTRFVTETDEEYDDNGNYISGHVQTISCAQTYEGDIYWEGQLSVNTEETVESIKAIAAGGISCTDYWHERTYAGEELFVPGSVETLKDGGKKWFWHSDPDRSFWDELWNSDSKNSNSGHNQFISGEILLDDNLKTISANVANTKDAIEAYAT